MKYESIQEKANRLKAERAAKAERKAKKEAKLAAEEKARWENFLLSRVAERLSQKAGQGGDPCALGHE